MVAVSVALAVGLYVVPVGVPTLESPQGIKSEPKIAWMVAARKKTCDFVHVITRFLFFHGFVTLCKFIEVDWYGIFEKIGKQYFKV